MIAIGATTPKKRGRPRSNIPSESLTPFGRLVAAALAERLRQQAHGPRTRADLARSLGCSRQQLNGALTGTRPRPTEDQIRAALPELGAVQNANETSAEETT